MRFEDEAIRIEQAYRLSEMTAAKTKWSKADVPVCEALAEFLLNWRSRRPCQRGSDYVFASDTLNGKKPPDRADNQPLLSQAGGDRSGDRPTRREVRFHSQRHSLGTWVHSATKDLKVAQTILRRSKPDVTAGTYIHGVPEENLKAKGEFMRALMKEGSSPRLPQFYYPVLVEN